MADRTNGPPAAVHGDAAKKPASLRKGSTIAALPVRRKSARKIQQQLMKKPPPPQRQPSQLSNVGKMLRQRTHGGEISPGWRTRDALVSPVDGRHRMSGEQPPSPDQEPKGDMPTNYSLEEASLRGVETFVSRDSTSTDSEIDPDIPEVLANFYLTYPNMRRLPPEEYILHEHLELDGDETEAHIGSGGQGAIYRCTLKLPTDPARLVAVKVSYKESVLEEYLIARRFCSKYLLKAIGFTVHPEYEVKRDEDGFEMFPYRSREKAFLRDMLKHLLLGLEYVHSCGWIHCDIKPENILVAEDLSIRLGDFGMFQRIGERMKAQGTPSYLSPEVLDAWFRPRDFHTFSAKADIFSLGVTIVAILTGKFPFGRITARLRAFKPLLDSERVTFFRISSKRLRELNAINPGYETIVKGCLMEDPEKRPSARSLLHSMGIDVNEEK